MGCKRVLMADDYYPALQRDNVELVTDRIERITPTGIVTADGREHGVDVLVLCTGFKAAEAEVPFPVVGRDQQDLATVWGESPEAYLGTTVAGFPNMFVLVGPNTGLGHNSMIFMMESQVNYVLSAVRLLRRRRLRSLEVRAAVQRRYNERLQRRLAHSVWATGGCNSWYQTSTGRLTTVWPGFTWEFRLRTLRLRPADYHLTPAEASAVAPAERAPAGHSAVEGAGAVAAASRGVTRAERTS
jgi:hypothetical protein